MLFSPHFSFFDICVFCVTSLMSQKILLSKSGVPMRDNKIEVTKLLINKSTMRMKRQFVLGTYSLLQWRKDDKNALLEKMSSCICTENPLYDVRCSI